MIVFQAGKRIPFLPRALPPFKTLRAHSVRMIAASLIVAIATGFAAPPATAQVGTVKATHGFWDVKCGKPPGSKREICWVEQKVTSEDRPTVGLTVTFFQTPNGKDRTLQVQAPLGIVLPRGLGLSVDGKDVGNVPFWRCFKAGCLARAEVPVALYDQLRKGKTAIFIIFDTPEAGIGIPISLSGFSKALGSLN